MSREVSIVSAACASRGEITLLRSAARFAPREGGGAARLPESFDHMPDVPRLRPGRDAAEAAAGEAGPRHFRASRLVCDVVAMALADAGFAPEDVSGPKTGFVSGSYYGCVDFLDELRAAERAKGPRGVKPTEFAIATHGYPVAALGMTFGAQGPATAFVSGLTAGFEALGFALTMLAQRQCDRMIVIGFEIPGDRVRPHLGALRRSAADEPADEVVETVVALVLERAPASGALAVIEDLRSWFDPDPHPRPDGRPMPDSLGADGLLRLFERLAQGAFSGAARATHDAAPEAGPFEIICSDPLGPRASVRARSLAAPVATPQEQAA